MSKLSSYIVILSFIAAGLPAAAQAPGEKPVMVEDVFKNVQVLKGLPVNQFMETMGMFASSIGENCIGCHANESLANWSKFAEDVPKKVIARKMIQMVDNINKTNFGGARVVTCWSCHRGNDIPETVPNLASQYNIPDEDPNALEIAPNGPKEPTANQILDKYIQGLGGAQRLANLKSFVAKGTLSGFDTEHVPVPLEIYAKAPNQRAMIWHMPVGDNSIVFDGSAGWFAEVINPVRLLAMQPGAELDGANLDAVLDFPAGLRQTLTDWRVGFPPTMIGGKDVNIVQGMGAGKTRFKLYFESQSGLLVRQLRYDGTPVGLVPIQVDYEDYRDVAGVKLPFKIVITWTDGQSHIVLNDIQPNATIDPQKFGRPAPPAVR